VDRFGVYDASGVFLGGPEMLALLPTTDVRGVRRLTDIEETVRFGRTHPAGAVIVTLSETR